MPVHLQLHYCISVSTDDAFKHKCHVNNVIFKGFPTQNCYFHVNSLQHFLALASVVAKGSRAFLTVQRQSVPVSCRMSCMHQSCIELCRGGTGQGVREGRDGWNGTGGGWWQWLGCLDQTQDMVRLVATIHSCCPSWVWSINMDQFGIMTAISLPSHRSKKLLGLTPVQREQGEVCQPSNLPIGWNVAFLIPLHRCRGSWIGLGCPSLNILLFNKLPSSDVMQL